MTGGASRIADEQVADQEQGQDVCQKGCHPRPQDGVLGRRAPECRPEGPRWGGEAEDGLAGVVDEPVSGGEVPSVTEGDEGVFGSKWQGDPGGDPRQHEQDERQQEGPQRVEDLAESGKDAGARRIHRRERAGGARAVPCGGSGQARRTLLRHAGRSTVKDHRERDSGMAQREARRARTAAEAAGQLRKREAKEPGDSPLHRVVGPRMRLTQLLL